MFNPRQRDIPALNWTKLRQDAGGWTAKQKLSFRQRFVDVFIFIYSLYGLYVFSPSYIFFAKRHDLDKILGDLHGWFGNSLLNLFNAQGAILPCFRCLSVITLRPKTQGEGHPVGHTRTTQMWKSSPSRTAPLRRSLFLSRTRNVLRSCSKSSSFSCWAINVSATWWSTRSDQGSRDRYRVIPFHSFTQIWITTRVGVKVPTMSSSKPCEFYFAMCTACTVCGVSSKLYMTKTKQRYS